ncbi:MAG: hypothetical protein M3Q15_04450 [Pseudomonadota bacterium]|nr:hypothetical protein [Pseudomonadota bacterium]
MILAATPALSADWKVVGFTMGAANRGVTYVDAASIKPKRDRIRFRSEQYLESGGQGYDRISTTSEVDCASMTLTVLRESYHRGPALIAFGPAPREENHYSPSTSQHWTLRRICDGSYLSGSVLDHSRDSARLFTLEWSPVPGRLAVATPIAMPSRPLGTQVASRGATTATLASRR